MKELLTFLVINKKFFLICLVFQIQILYILIYGDYSLARSRGFDVIKQHEKMITDPSDIHVSDLQKFKYICDTKYFNFYLNLESQPMKSVVVDSCLEINKAWQEDYNKGSIIGERIRGIIHEH